MESVSETSLTVRGRRTWPAVAQAVACLALLGASAAFTFGGVLRGFELGATVFAVLGLLGMALFGAGLVVALGRLLTRRPVLVVDGAGVHRPPSWPMPTSRTRTLPWSDVVAVGALRRGLHGTRRGEQDYVVFLPTEETVELMRTAERPGLVALTLPDVPPAALPPGGEKARAWCLSVQDWDVSLPELVRRIREMHRVPVVDRRNR